MRVLWVIITNICYRINIHEQRAHMGSDLLKEECCPVTLEENKETVSSTLFAFVSGESFLLALHIMGNLFAKM